MPFRRDFEMWFRSDHHPLCICQPNCFHREVPATRLERAFDIHSLGSEVLIKLFHEVSSLITGIRIEIIPSRRSDGTGEEHPASTIGLPLEIPTIQFTDSLSRIKRIEAVAHELVHLLLIYRYGLGVIGRKIPRYGNSDDVFRYFMTMGGNWAYLLGQLGNTAHHLVLIDYLREEYEIQSDLHHQLLHHNLQIIANKNWQDKESLYAKGIIAFEYEKLIGKVDRLINLDCQTEFFWKSYHSAQKHFDKYSFHSIPDPSSYKEDILSFLETLEYQKEDFIFSP